MLGTLGIVPAFDQFFCSAFRELSRKNNTPISFRQLNKKTLDFFHSFYLIEENQKVLDDMQIKLTTLDFNSGKNSNISYPIAKLIDMVGFQMGLELKKDNKRT